MFGLTFRPSKLKIKVLSSAMRAIKRLIHQKIVISGK